MDTLIIELTTQWSVLYRKTLNGKANFVSVQNRISSWIDPGQNPMVYTAIYSKNVLTYVALFHNDLCFMANHCIIRPILGVSSMGLHPGWIPLPNITSQWSVLYGNPLKCKSNFRSLLHRISSRIYPGWIPHHHYNFKAAHCMVRPILGVFSMGFHPGWIQISALC